MNRRDILTIIATIPLLQWLKPADPTYKISKVGPITVTIPLGYQWYSRSIEQNKHYSGDGHFVQIRDEYRDQDGNWLVINQAEHVRKK